MQNIGIFGTTLSGKTTLAIKLTGDFWHRKQMRSLVLDPYNHVWGEHALCFEDENKFWQTVWSANSLLVVVDEASSTINRNKDLKPVFTRLRHHGHKLIVIGHSSADLLPVMRQSLDTLFLFRHSEKSAAVWSETFTNKDILAASELRQYEFLFCRLYQPSIKQKLALK
jgi:hypothetical protein